MSNTFALLIGINYIGQNSELSGCINDVNDMNKLLTEVFKIPQKNITIMTDNTKGQLYPTRSNIIKNIVKLVIKAHKGQADRIILHYSGHGYYVKDLNGDELDKWDEVICPVDYDKNGFITDDLLNATIRIVPDTCSIFVLMDCCNSGTNMDLKYRHKFGDEHSVVESDINMKAPAVMISGCRDDQTSADAYISGRYNGAMTRAFLTCLKDANYNINYFDLLTNMRKYLKDNNYTQIPELSASYELTSLSTFCCPKVDNAFISY